jgi:hypothetical protein
VVWHITRLEKHGITNLRFGSIVADLLCERRAKAEDACRITVTSSGTFTLVVIAGHQKLERTITRGTHTLVVPVGRSGR